mmetsp:Transcript_11518/g.26330  ORF Transcript_11518/g.26330 Transcript_11518/m.26330 type:complete len:204 (-) Transcript_11518:379-990(-)
MGGIFTRLLQTFSFKKKVCVLITGEFGSGKTTIMYQWLLGKCITPVHTVGSHLETLELEDVTFEFFDIGGETKSRPIIQHVVSRNLSNYKKRGIVFVIDSCDREWVGDTRKLLRELLESDVARGVPLLVLANKQDRSDAMSVEEITEVFELESIEGRPMLIKGCCALTGKGIEGVLPWLVDPKSSQEFTQFDPKNVEEDDQMC